MTLSVDTLTLRLASVLIQDYGALRMTMKFSRERNLVERLVQRLGLPVDDCEDPNASDFETGADVTLLRGGGRIGVQVTILDTRAAPGKAIAAEKR